MAASIRVRTLANVNLTLAGTAQQVSTTPIYCASVIIQAHEDNTNDIFVGDSNVAVGRGFRLDAGESITFGNTDVRGTTQEVDLSQIYFDGDTTNEDIRVTYLQLGGN